jgi:hypothetical protein
MKAREPFGWSQSRRLSRWSALAVCLVTLVAVIVGGAAPAFAVAPGAPEAPYAIPLSGMIAVQFNPPADAGSSAITSYTATCLPDIGGTVGSVTQPAPTTTPITIVVPGLTNGASYTCTVVAANDDGAGAPSPQSNDVTPNSVPDAPDQPTVAASDSSINVSFAPPSNAGSAITQYTAACTSSDGGAFNSVTSAVSTLTANSIDVDGLTNGNTYTCTVSASNTDGPGPNSLPSLPAVPSTIPGAPLVPDAKSTGVDITVSFTAPSDGGSSITNYTVSCVSSDGGVTGTANGATSPLVVSGVTVGSTYNCTVFATNGNGDGPASPLSPNVIPGARPGAPATPAVVPGNARITVSFSPPDDGGSPITGYSAKCTGAGATTGLAQAGTSPIAVSGLTNGKSYTCTVVATNENGPGPPSSASVPVIPRTVPSQVGVPTVVGGNGRVSVAFHAPVTGGFPITQYRVTCASSNGGGTRMLLAAGSPFVMTGLTNGADYRCTVAAASAAGWGPTSLPSATVTPLSHGFRMFTGDGSVFVFGDAKFYGSAASSSLVIAMATTRDNSGYWLFAQNGAVWAFGTARSYGSLAGRHLNQPIVGATATPTGRGYWLVASDGGIFAFGDARFYGSTGNIRLRSPIVGMTATASGRGYWFVAADGGLFAYGDARFFGSAAGRVDPSRTPIVGMATSAAGLGYWIVASNGVVFGYGNARVTRAGALPNLRLPIRGIAATDDGRGFWIAAGDGGLFVQGDAPYIPWPGPIHLKKQVRGISR